MPRGTQIPGDISKAAAMYMARAVAESPFTREAVAHASGIAEGRVSSLLNGKRSWYLEDVERIARVLGLPPLDCLDAIGAYARAHATVTALPLRKRPTAAKLKRVARRGKVTGDDATGHS